MMQPIAPAVLFRLCFQPMKLQPSTRHHLIHYFILFFIFWSTWLVKYPCVLESIPSCLSWGWYVFISQSLVSPVQRTIFSVLYLCFLLTWLSLLDLFLHMSAHVLHLISIANSFPNRLPFIFQFVDESFFHSMRSFSFWECRFHK